MNPSTQLESFNLICRCNISEKRKNLVKQIHRYFDLPQRGVYILIDNDDLSNYGNKLYAKSKALYMNIKSGGFEERSPKYILDILYKPDCEHFIWISKSTAQSTDIEFCWIYSHELHHMMQDIKDPRLSKLGAFLRRAYPSIKSIVQIDIPTELEAELKAKEIVIKMFGKASYKSYVDKEITNNETAKSYFKKFDELKENWSGDVLKEILKILCQHKEQFINLQAGEKNKKMTLDIQELCSKLSGG